MSRLNKKDKNPRLDGMMGLVVGDALGCPVQFMSREEIRNRKKGPVAGMEGYGTYNMPEGTWTDDSSMALATLDSIRELGIVDPEDIMTRFIDWYEDGEYTPFGEAFDIGNTCSFAIEDYEENRNLETCGRTSDRSNGNGSLMRILPVCIYAFEEGLSDESAIDIVHEVSGLTHNHLRSKIGCGLYYFMVKGLLNADNNSLLQILRDGLNKGFQFYEKNGYNKVEISHYDRLRNIDSFKDDPEREIRSSGYVVDSLEAAVWSLITTNSFEDCLLKAVNLGDDTDTVAAIAGGLAGLFYGYDDIPEDWLTVIKRREWIEKMCSINEEKGMQIKETDLIKEYKTPFYFYDIERLSQRIKDLREYLPGIGVCFAMKAAPSMASYAAEFADRIEVCSPGEYEIVLRGGVTPEKIFYSGVNKTEDVVRRVVDTAGDKCIYTIESRKHFEILKKLSSEKKLNLRVFPRLSAGSQFGVEEEEFFKLCKEIEETETLTLTGVHYFSGTQKRPSRIDQELIYMEEIGERLNELLGRKIELEYGPGLLVNYFKESEIPQTLPDEEALMLLSDLQEAVQILKDSDVYSHITFEHGRFIAACTGKYYTSVCDIKKTNGSNYTILDGGIHQMTYFGSMNGMKTPYMQVFDMEKEEVIYDNMVVTEPEDLEEIEERNKKYPEELEKPESYVLCGSLCSTNDVLVRKAEFGCLSEGNVICFNLAGAYALTEGIALLLSRDMPAIIVRETDGNFRVLREHVGTDSLNA